MGFSVDYEVVYIGPTATGRTFLHQSPTALFRREVVDHRTNRLHGDVRLAMPLSWQVIGYLLFAAVIAAGLFLSLASYSRITTAPGSIVLDRGVAPIVPSRSGVLLTLPVADGRHVKAGTVIATIKADEQIDTSGTAPDQILSAIDRQDAGLADQSAATIRAARAETDRQNARVAGLEAESASLDVQITVQRDLVARAKKEVETVGAIASRGFISRRDMMQREEAVLSRQQQLAALEQGHAAKVAELVDARKSIGQSLAQAAAQTASLVSSRAELAQRRVDANSGRGYALTAPIDGTVSAVVARPGQTVTSQQSLMTIVPDDAVPRAELYIPTGAIAFLRVGQTVHLAIDAFPYQRFGTVDATIMQISATTIARAEAGGATEPVYLVVTRIARPWVSAFGRRERLLPGMTLTARIVTDRQNLLRWLFEPLFAVINR